MAKINAAKVSDIPAILALDKQEYGSALKEPFLRSMITERRLNQVKVLRKGSRLLGYIIWARFDPRTIYLTSVGGPGKHVLLEWFLAQPHTRAYTHASPHWDIKLLETHGFADVGPGDPTREPVKFFQDITKLRTYEHKKSCGCLN